MKKFQAVIFLAVVSLSGEVAANTEPPSAYDARSVGMGSTGVAHVENGASLYHNPASLDGVERGAVTAAFSPLAPQLTTPLAGPDTEVESVRTFGPLFLVGGAYRVHERVTVGAAVFPTMGFGAKYEDVDALGGNNLSAQLSVLEIAPGASVAILDNLALGIAYRISRFAYSAETPVLAPPPAPAGTLVTSEADLNGWNFTGLHVGIQARPTSTTRLGLSYRTKATADLEGSTDFGGQDLDTSMEFAVPHIFKLGVAQALLDDDLLLALDFRYALFQDANEELVVTTDVPGGGSQEQTVELDWKNSFGAYFGAEYWVAHPVAVRAGYSVVSSATPGKTAQPIMPAPGLQHGIHAGVGIAIQSLEVDVGGYYMFGGKYAKPEAEPPGSANGNYGWNAVMGSLSATYRFGSTSSTNGEQ